MTGFLSTLSDENWDPRLPLVDKEETLLESFLDLRGISVVFSSSIENGDLHTVSSISDEISKSVSVENGDRSCVDMVDSWKLVSK